MKRSVLIIEDIETQAKALNKELGKLLPHTDFYYAYDENEIDNAIESRYFSVAIVDLRMDGFKTDGVGFIKKIIEYVNTSLFISFIKLIIKKDKNTKIKKNKIYFKILSINVLKKSLKLSCIK